AVAASPGVGAKPAGWGREGSTIARVAGILRDGNELRGVTLFLRDARGNLRQHLTARRAVYADGAWRLFDVEPRLISSTGTVASAWLAEAPWQTKLTPDHFSDLSAPPTTLSLKELAAFVANPGVGNRPTYFYETWLHKRLAIPVASFLMVLLAAPVAQGLRRHGGIAAGLTAGVGLGFLFFVTDGLVLALGEAGALPPALAAWSATVVFASVGGAALIRMEGY
ncbi:MAG: LptF/LptG family permease, partial [Dongiaceae bacterium]